MLIWVLRGAATTLIRWKVHVITLGQHASTVKKVQTMSSLLQRLPCFSCTLSGWLCCCSWQLREKELQQPAHHACCWLLMWRRVVTNTMNYIRMQRLSEVIWDPWVIHDWCFQEAPGVPGTWDQYHWLAVAHGRACPTEKEIAILHPTWDNITIFIWSISKNSKLYVAGCLHVESHSQCQGL